MVTNLLDQGHTAAVRLCETRSWQE